MWRDRGTCVDGGSWGGEARGTGDGVVEGRQEGCSHVWSARGVGWRGRGGWRLGLNMTLIRGWGARQGWGSGWGLAG
ncbi:hypothetical protein E2C01_063700 [Portunus trituberculatus]|uniref:Uncharacterized protein n=1 Tax=Portunus trituberculatus TaxID=210409 RepID=A0A5B7HLM1_PORTR|nr:hypothetical protein [Portunus trituberculatus]